MKHIVERMDTQVQKFCATLVSGFTASSHDVQLPFSNVAGVRYRQRGLKSNAVILCALRDLSASSFFSAAETPACRAFFSLRGGGGGNASLLRIFFFAPPQQQQQDPGIKNTPHQTRRSYLIRG